MAEVVAMMTPSMYWSFAVAASVGGASLAFLDDGSASSGSGYSPAAHVGACRDCTEVMMSDLFVDGTGLGLLEPLWRLCTPEGALWTLLTGWSPRDNTNSLGLSGLLQAVGSLLSGLAAIIAGGFAAFYRLMSSKKGKAKASSTETGVPKSTAHEKLQMTYFVELNAYWGYFKLFALGVFREYLLRSMAVLVRDELSLRYVSREKWSTGWVDFYLQHMYKLFIDCFNRPICSAPDASFDVVHRTRSGGLLFSPLTDFKLSATEFKTCVNLSSYNYLGFGGVDSFCTPAAKRAALELGWSTCGTRTEGGTISVHRELEKEVAEYLKKEDAMVLGMGFATNSTILPALFEAGCGAGVLILSDELNHRSIVEGVRLSGATIRAFAHNDVVALETELRRAHEQGQNVSKAVPSAGKTEPAPAPKPWRKIFVVVEGIYSMEGDFCRLREIVTLKNRYGAYLYLDEAHSIGAVGATGRGVTELLGVPTEEVDVMMGTFTKSFGSAGGYVAASKAVISALRRQAPGCVFGGAMAPPCAAQALMALRVISGKLGGNTGKEKLAAIRDNANYFRSRLVKEGAKVLGDEDSPIVPMMLNHPDKLAGFSRLCYERGVAVVVVGNPAVPVLYERVRFCISAAHTRDQLSKALDAIVEVSKQLGVLFDRSADPAELQARSARDAEYFRWTRSAPLECRKGVAMADAAKNFKPESLAPASAAAAGAGLPEMLESAAATVTESSAKDLRRLDPLNFGARPSEAAKAATEVTMAKYGFGACGPRGFYGTTVPHLDLEAGIAKFLGTESAITYSAGVATASSVLPALVQQGDRVIIDSEVNLGLRAGLRLCKAEITWVPHCDAAAFKAALETPVAVAKGAKQRRTFLVAEGISQRTGRLAPLKELLELKDRFGAMIVLDESLSFGSLGAHGRGLCEHLGVAPSRVDALIGSLEHAMAGVGGFCAGRRGLVDHQRLAGAGYCFSAAAPPSSAASAAATLEELASAKGAERLTRLAASVPRLHQALQEVCKASGKVSCTSSPESFAQFLRWSKEGQEAEAKLLAVGAALGAAGWKAQVCNPSQVGAEKSFNQRIGATGTSVPTLRICASGDLSEKDIEALKAALATAVSKC